MWFWDLGSKLLCEIKLKRHENEQITRAEQFIELAESRLASLPPT